MLTRSDMELELQHRIMTANNSGMTPPARLTKLIQDATLWAGVLHFWPALQRARMSTAYTNSQNLNYDYYDYPTDFLDDSVSRLYIDGKKYFPKAFQDLLDYADQSVNPIPINPQDLFFANYGRQFFTFPSYRGSPPVNNLIVWGNIQHPPLLNSTDTTIFSRNDESGNEAIVQKAFSVETQRSDPAAAGAAKNDAITLLGALWAKVEAAQQRAQRVNHQFFAVPDFFAGSGVSAIGNFNIPINTTNNF